jgi:hypothetical protein
MVRKQMTQASSQYLFAKNLPVCKDVPQYISLPAAAVDGDNDYQRFYMPEQSSSDALLATMHSLAHRLKKLAASSFSVIKYE